MPVAASYSSRSCLAAAACAISNGYISCMILSKWKLELPRAGPIPDQTVFEISSPGLCSGTEFFLVRKTDRLLSRFEPHCYKTCRAQGSYCPFEYLLGGSYNKFHNSSFHSILPHTSYNPSCCNVVTTSIPVAMGMSKRQPGPSRGVGRSSGIFLINITIVTKFS